MTESLETRVQQLEQRVDKLENEIQAGGIRATEGDLEAFLKDVEPATHIQRSVTIGYYLLHEEGQDSFTINDIEGGYNKCRIAKPANFSDVLAGAQEKEWTMRYRKEGQTQLWKVTPEGDLAVEGGFQE